jgi:acetyltransferase-like isoleucine patch superfamily enzyme
MSIKSIFKRYALKKAKNIIIDQKSILNFNVINRGTNSQYPCLITNSDCNIETIDEGCRISDARCYGEIVLGRFTTITGPGTVIKSLKEKIHIGSFSSIGQNVCIVDFNHNFDRVTSCFVNYLLFQDEFVTDLLTKGPVIIEEDVWVGSNSLILPGVKIGRGAIIGGGSVVTKDIPSYSIAIGNPAKVVSMRFNPLIIDQLEKSKWWEWSIEKIHQNKEIFNLNLNKSTLEEIDILFSGAVK